MNQNNIGCIDCGSDNCPCYLAETSDCLICGRLQGKDYCDCNYAGVCIYNEYLQGGQRVNNPRKPFATEILEKKEFYKDITVFKLKVPRGFAMKCSAAGSFVFLKTINDPDFYQLPVSVMKTDMENGSITLAVQKSGSKSKKLHSENTSLIVRGVYRNGVIGINSQVLKAKHISVLAKGIAVAPLFLILDSLSNKIDVEIFLDLDKISYEFVYSYLPIQYHKSIQIISINKSLTEKCSFDFFNGEKNRIVLTSDYYINEVKKIIDVAAYSNNAKICCGEGICGSCIKNNGKEDVIKLCKCKKV